MELRNIDTRLEDIKNITRQVTWNINNLALYDYPITWFDDWEDFKGETVYKGRVLVYKGIKYYVLSNQIIVSDHVIPSTITSRSVYRPIQGRENVYNWVYGESIYAAFQRNYEGVTYEAIRDLPHSENIVTPDLKTDIWKATETI